MKRAFVTGASGLIGAHLVRELERHHWQVCALVRASSRLDALEGTRAERVIGDVLNAPDSLAASMADCEVVFHTAAQFVYAGPAAASMEATAIEGTRNVVQAAALAGVNRVVVTSSSVVFGSTQAPQVLDETAPLGCASADGFAEPPYVASKVRQDHLAAELGRSLGIEVLFACPTMTVGSQATALSPSNAIIIAYLADPLRMTYPGGCNIVSVRDVAAGHLLIAERGADGEHFLLGSENLEWRQVHSMIADLCGIGRPHLSINHTMAFCAGAFNEFYAAAQGRTPLTSRQQARMIGRWYWYSHSKAAALGFNPRPARAALAEACAWLAASEHVSRELRATMLLSPEVHAARATLDTWSPA